MRRTRTSCQAGRIVRPSTAARLTLHPDAPRRFGPFISCFEYAVVFFVRVPRGYAPRVPPFDWFRIVG